MVTAQGLPFSHRDDLDCSATFSLIEIPPNLTGAYLNAVLGDIRIQPSPSSMYGPTASISAA